MPQLSQLDATFIRYETVMDTFDVVEGDADTWRQRGCPTVKMTSPREHMIIVKTLAEAQGVMFQCPKCYKTNGHNCSVTFANRGVPDDQGTHNSKGEPVRWTVTGTGLHDLTTKPSVQLQGGCNWHGWITNGSAD